MRNNKFLKVNSFNPENMRSSKKYKKSGTRNSANKEKGKNISFSYKKLMQLSLFAPARIY